MKRILLGGAMALMTVLAGCGGGGGGAEAVTPTPTPPPTPTPTTPTPTARINKSIKVAYIGAAVTAGAGATNQRGWATLTTEYLTAQFSAVASRNIGLGRTDSLFGTHRIDQQLADFAPDYAFISFTNNDGDDANVQNSYTDAMIYKLRRLNPNVVISIVAVTRSNDEQARRAGGVPVRVANLKQLASDEGVVLIDAGEAVWNKVIAEGKSITDFLPDGGNPNDAGHAVYAAAIKASLDPRLETLTGLGRLESRYIGQTNLQDARLIATSTVTSNTCPVRDFGTIFLNAALDCSAGQGFTVVVTGTSFGHIRGLSLGGGQLDCTLDGGTPQSEMFFESEPDAETTATSINVRPRLQYTGLANAPHTLACQVNATAPAGSTGTRVVVGGFLVNSGRQLSQ